MNTSVNKPTNLDVPTRKGNIEMLINTKERDIYTEDCLCTIDEVEEIKLIEEEIESNRKLLEELKAKWDA